MGPDALTCNDDTICGGAARQKEPLKRLNTRMPDSIRMARRREAEQFIAMHLLE